MEDRAVPRDERLPTGDAGLDNVLMGGFLKEGFYLLQGDPGSGKTTLALQFIQGRLRANARCLYVSLTESRADLERTCHSHGWSLDGIELLDFTQRSVSDNASSVFDPADTELSEITRAIATECERVRPDCVVFDGLSEIRLLAGDALRYRRQLLSLKEYFAAHRATVLLLDDRTAKFEHIQPESLVGGNIVLELLLPAYGRARRRIHVTKVRGAHFRDGYHDYEIITGDGVVVYPRLVASDHHSAFATELRPSGVPNLDAMLYGGLAAGSTTLLLGPAGVGKSTVSIQFVVNALKRGDKAAVYVFDEVMHLLVERSEKLCFGKPGGFRSYLDQGLLHAQQIDAAELSPGAFAREVCRVVEAGAKVVVIDSLNGYMNAMTEERFLTTHLHELFSYLNQKGVVTIVVAAQHGMLVPGTPSDLDVSYLADTVLLFRYFEAEGAVNQALSVFKRRNGPHERTIRELSIDTQGIRVGEPLRRFRGIMSGIPQYERRPEAGESAGDVER